ncbi:uncharacterized protein MONOS_14286 [Monocercomonoides exilis]|uniref:uncharacterized protein n=1 Tax=Monocercomonoides exilis TaxID=2049356 RepID=UPI00355ABE54|nr:hypothetical protein MONOS_14286 [Monocercomonoides exilis]|eukprot:MONOS_14286.1-p1 / transcript=MONOS_14286.1 / gene=MONOS_14286 / organism=Monocercomonoides_exilis_PA203 / gene_product=unspecified product / transcript_product=unspecified product / location=Mono_scaffold00971:14167-16955(-) / protein_length=762 / sequence_SO=supercontig / SO=protein_coding / is_pseudo=false
MSSTRKPLKKVVGSELSVPANGQVDLQRKGYTSFEGMPSTHNISILYLQMNHFTTFDHFPVLLHLKELYMAGTQLASLHGLRKQPQIKLFDCQRTPFSKNPHFRLMSLISFGSTLFKINDVPITSKERGESVVYGPLLYDFLNEGFLIRSVPEKPVTFFKINVDDEKVSDAISGYVDIVACEREEANQAIYTTSTGETRTRTLTPPPTSFSSSSHSSVRPSSAHRRIGSSGRLSHNPSSSSISSPSHSSLRPKTSASLATPTKKQIGKIPSSASASASTSSFESLPSPSLSPSPSSSSLSRTPSSSSTASSSLSSHQQSIQPHALKSSQSASSTSSIQPVQPTRTKKLISSQPHNKPSSSSSSSSSSKAEHVPAKKKAATQKKAPRSSVSSAASLATPQPAVPHTSTWFFESITDSLTKMDDALLKTSFPLSEIDQKEKASDEKKNEVEEGEEEEDGEEGEGEGEGEEGDEGRKRKEMKKNESQANVRRQKKPDAALFRVKFTAPDEYDGEGIECEGETNEDGTRRKKAANAVLRAGGYKDHLQLDEKGITCRWIKSENDKKKEKEEREKRKLRRKERESKRSEEESERINKKAKEVERPQLIKRNRRRPSYFDFDWEKEEKARQEKLAQKGGETKDDDDDDDFDDDDDEDDEGNGEEAEDDEMLMDADDEELDDENEYPLDEVRFSWGLVNNITSSSTSGNDPAILTVTIITPSRIPHTMQSRSTVFTSFSFECAHPRSVIRCVDEWKKWKEEREGEGKV